MNLKPCEGPPMAKKTRGKLNTKTLHTMRLILLFILLSGLKVIAQSTIQPISLNFKNAPVATVLESIKKQNDYSLITEDHLFDNTHNITLNLKNVTIQKALDECFKGQSLTYQIVGKTILVKKQEQLPKTSSQLPDITIKGKVTDTTKTPIRGASVKLEGTNITVAADINGEFTISASNNSILVISAIGYQGQTITVTDNRPINISLHQSYSKLDEVQIIAYGTTTQRLNTGSVTKVSSAEIMSQPINNPLAALEGRVAGLTVTQSNGVPGSQFRLELRGQNTLATSGGAGARNANSDPLFIIDGIPFAPNNSTINTVSSSLSGATTTGGLSPFSLINPEDIESIEVLKDAASTAIYGSRGGNGVILITTKKGKAGKTKFNANVYSGISQDTHIPELLNTDQYLAMRREAYKNDGTTPTATNAPDLLVYDNNSYTNFPKMFLGGKAPVTDAQASLSGGNENTSFLLSGGFHREGTVYPGDMSVNRTSFHVNLNNSSNNKKFITVFSASYSHGQNNLIAVNLPNSINLAPDFPPLTDAQGNLLWSYNSVSFRNPLAYLKNQYNSGTDNLISSLQINYQVLPGLSIRSDFGYNKVNVVETETFPISSQAPSTTAQGSSDFGNNNFSGWSMEPQIEYKSSISKGKLDILLGGTWQYNKNDNNSTIASGYVNDALLKSISAASSLYTTSNFYEYKYQAFFGRINYNWDSRYIIDITARRDGSSRFGPNKQFSNFGALGGAWLFTNESFLKDRASILSYGKIRGSYGVTGTDQIGDYQYLDSWSVTNNTYQGNPGLYPTRLNNADYGWEKNKKAEIGLELGFFKDRFLLTSSYFTNTSDNHLISYSEPSQTGFTSITKNFPAVIRNNGFEFTLSTRNITASKFNWTTSANITFQQNELVSFPGIETSSYASIYKVGQSLDIIQGYQYLGVDPATGLFKFKDQNGDNLYNATDLVNLGNFNPKYYGGISNTFTYKDLELNFFVEFKKQLGRSYLTYSYNGLNSPGAMVNQPIAVLDRWQNPGDVTNYRKFTATNTGASLFSGYNGYVITDASYWRLKSLSLGYNLPKSWTNRMRLQNLKFYAQGSNLLTFTPFKVADPETQALNELPPLRTITVGLQLSL